LKRWRRPNAKGAGHKDKSGEMVALMHIKPARKLLDRAATSGESRERT